MYIILNNTAKVSNTMLNDKWFLLSNNFVSVHVLEFGYMG